MSVSNHAKQRIKERMGLPTKAALRQANLAYENGIRREQLNGRVRRYIDKFYFEHERKDTYIIYNNTVFIFDGKLLVTVLVLPSEFSRLMVKYK